MWKSFFIGLLSFLTYPVSSFNQNDVKNLKEDLFFDYNKDVIPKPKNKSLDLKLGIALRSFNKVDQVEGTMEANIWLRHYWRDERLSWNPDEYNKVKEISCNTNGEYDRPIWIPDVYLYNTAEMPLSNLDLSNAIVYHTGNVIWSRPGMVTSSCIFDLSDFPYDTQDCYLKFGSWSYHGFIMNMTVHSSDIDTSNYKYNEEWKLKKVFSERDVKIYGCCPEPYPSVLFHFILERKSGYYDLNIIIPTFATATLMIISMIIPWDSGERISFAVTVMLSLIVFLLILSDSLPNTDQNPRLSEMLVGLMFFSLIVVFFTVIITAMRNADKNSIVFRKLIMFMKRRGLVKGCTRVEEKGRRNSYNEAMYTEDLMKEECQNLANKLECLMTFVFMISFISYALIMLL
jgi:cation transporter family protein